MYSAEQREDYLKERIKPLYKYIEQLKNANISPETRSNSINTLIDKFVNISNRDGIATTREEITELLNTIEEKKQQIKQKNIPKVNDKEEGR